MFSKAGRYSILAILWLFFSCQSVSYEINTRILDVFSDYVFVGTGSAKFDPNGTLDTKVAMHTSNEQPRPSLIKKDIQYIFHHLAPVDNELLALQELPRRLSQMGYKVTKAPKNLVELFSGGPLFYIEFADGEHEGVVFNQLDMQVGDTWTTHDYVLVYTR